MSFVLVPAPVGTSLSASIVQLDVGLTTGSWVGLIIAPLLLLGLGVFQLYQDPPAFGAFVALLVVATVFGVVALFRAQALVSRGWPGLLAEANRLATGSLYVPAA